MKRRALKLLLFLLLGALLNYFLCPLLWWCSDKEKPPGTLVNPIGGQVIWEHYAPPDWVLSDPLPFHVQRFNGRTTRILLVMNKREAGQLVVQSVVGWPCIGLRGGVAQDGNGRIISSRGVWSPFGLPSDWVFFLIPLWPGFAINTIFYAAIVWMFFALPGVLRRRRRMKCGLCPQCAYPVGTAENCTECGATVKPTP